MPRFNLLRPFLPLLLVSLCSCAAHTSAWRDNAHSRFASALAAGSPDFAAEETENIKQTLELADRYYKSGLGDDADQLYQLACQKSQLLYRNLVLSKVREGSSILVAAPGEHQPVEVELDREHVSLQRLLEVSAPEDVAVPPGDMPTSSEVTAASGNAPSGTDAGVAQTIPTPEPPPATVPPQHNTPPGADSPAIAAVASPARSPDRKRPHTAVRERQKVVGRDPSSASPPEQRSGTPPTVYLTFDDGPSNLTLPIASFLKEQGVKATFFVLGSNIKGHEKVISSTLAMGHQVGNHTLSHNLRKLNGSLGRGSDEISATAAMVERLGGDGRMVRIPYGAVNNRLRSRVAAEGGQIFDWDINSNDSTRTGAHNPALIERTVLSQLRGNTKRHVVLLFHDGAGHASTLTALRSIVPKLQREGYRFGLLARREQVARTAAGERSVR